MKTKKYFQAIYITTFFICLLGIAGNIELDIKTPKEAIILTCITGFLTIVKLAYLIYLDLKGGKENVV